MQPLLTLTFIFALAIQWKMEIQLGLFNKEFIANTTTYWIPQRKAKEKLNEIP